MVLRTWTAAALAAWSASGLAQTPTASLPTVTVTATREEDALAETPASVGVVTREAIRTTRPAHPQELLARIPGVSVAATNGEGHTTAIRQGYTTAPVYLFLEDGIPVRATGSFNHNALYELNLPGAGGVEVVRGIGSALYGSDAIGGIVNVLSREPARAAGADASFEAGTHGYRRLLAGLDSGRADGAAVRADVNVTHGGGWRDATGYERASMNLRWDRMHDERTLVKTIVGYTRIDQQTGANSPLPYDLYAGAPTVNLRAPAYRHVTALRLSSHWLRDLGDGAALTLTPYLRRNGMDLNGAYNFTGDARIEVTEVASYGMLAKYRHDRDDAWRTRVIAGLDLDYSPGTRRETKIDLTTTGSGLATQYTGYRVAGVIYDYEVEYASAAPYLHLELSPAPRWRTVLGLRYDLARYQMRNRMTPGYVTQAGREYYSPAGAAADFARLSPKLGLTYQSSATTHLYASYHQGFRTPSESQLFRGGRSDAGGTQAARQAQALALSRAAAGLQAIRAEQFELGWRGLGGEWSFEVVGYRLTKKNDLLAQRDATGYVVQTNNGATSHQGLEFGFGRPLARTVRLDVATSYAKHTYTDWSVAGVDYSGRAIEAAPRVLASVRATWTPGERSQVQVEWVSVGSYPLDAENRYGRYPGHDLVHFRASRELRRDLTVYARLTNAFDRRYADSAAQGSAAGALYAPGLPRTVYAGLEYRI